MKKHTYPFLNRRDLIKVGLFAGGSLPRPLSNVVARQSVLAHRMPASKLPRPFTTPFVIPPVAVPIRTDDTTDYYRMSMQAAPVEIVPGFKTMFFTYDGTVPGPTIRVGEGRRAVVRHDNALPDAHSTSGCEPWTSVHPNLQRARTLWYHEHGIRHAAENAYHGLLAQYHMFDVVEQALPIPHGRYDVPLIMSDALFNKDGSLLYSLEDNSGLWGDVILVNGRPWPVMQVERRKYRFRILGAAISRSWNLTLDSGEPMTVIGTDGGLMPTPQPVRSFRAGSGERYEVVIDFSKYPIGRRVVVQNNSPANNRNFANVDKIMAFDVVSEPTDLSDNSIPDVLTTRDPVMDLQPNDAVRTRTFRYERRNGDWTINGRSRGEADGNFHVASANPSRGDVEIWELENKAGGWFRPVHIPLTDFKVLDRNGKPPFPHERGPKDVVYIGEGEKVRVMMKWEDRSLDL